MSLSQKNKELVDRHAKKIVDKGLGTMVIMMVDSMKPLSYVGSQLLHIANPMLTMIPYFRDFDKIAEMLEDRNNVEYFLTRVEYFMNEKNENKVAKKLSKTKEIAESQKTKDKTKLDDKGNH